MPTGHRSIRRHRAPLARYTNYFEVGHNAYEFLINFAQLEPETGEIVLHTRIATGPTHAKLLVDLLAKAVQEYEAECGEISNASEPPNPLELVHQSLPDFDQRAAGARRRNLPPFSQTSGSRKKR
jgi:hypothetical protein